MMNAFFCFVFMVRFINFSLVEGRIKHIYLRMKKYGNNVRRIDFNRMAIIYTVTKNVVSVKRIMPVSMIID